jgi:hypothetical protein
MLFPQIFQTSSNNMPTPSTGKAAQGPGHSLSPPTASVLPYGRGKQDELKR